jgi:hypothetical protein
MGIPSDILKKYAGDMFNIFDVNKLSTKQRKEIEGLYNVGVNDGSKSNKGSSSQDYSVPTSTTTTGEGFSLGTGGPLTDLITQGKDLAGVFSSDSMFSGVDSLIEKSQQLANSMGVGRARADEFRGLIADSVPEMIKLGISESEAMEKIKKIPEALKVNTTLTKESIVEISAASKLTSYDTGQLAEGFKNVGVNLNDVGDRMAEVANYAKSVGVNVTAVTDGVVKNIGKLNTMNFEGGIKGLTKMVAQSQMLGVNMESVLRKADTLMSPENAIEFSAALQRLGVQSSALLDPLSAMDMAMNDPAALQNEMVKISQQFTRMKADGSGFEILPGAKLQLKEVAEKLGLGADELANMSIKSADLEMKMSKIRFPGFAASEEDKQLIANMAQMKDGRAMVTIAKEGGGTEEVAVEDLTAEQIDKLKEEQANQNKTAEEIARDQLSVLKDISAQMEGQKSSIQMGIASTGAVQRVTNAVNEFRKTTMSEISEKVTTESTRDKLVSPALGTIEKGVIDAIVNKDLVSLATMLPELITNLTTAAQNIGTGTVDIMQNVLSKTGKNVTKEYGGVSGVKPGETNFTDYVVSQLENIKNEIQGKKTEPEKKQVDLNANYTVDIKGNASNLTNEEMKKIVEDKLKEIMTDPKLMNEFSASQTTATNSSGMGN